MGAAVAKPQALDHTAGVPGTRAEARLAVAAQALGQRGRIWDAEATCTNRSLLAAVDEILHLKRIHAFPIDSLARCRMYSALAVAMSRLLDEFLILRVWDASQLQSKVVHVFAVEKLSISMPCFDGAISFGGRLSSAEFSFSTSHELYTSDTSLSSWPDVLTVIVDGAFSEEVDLIYPASLPVLHEIALRVIRAGYTKQLVKAFAKASYHVLDRFLSILQLERPSFDANRVNFEDAEWWTAEDMVKRWILAAKLVAKALVVMQRQLHGQNCGAFDRFKDDYAKQSIVVLLKFADGFTSTHSPEKLIYVLEMYATLSNSAPGLLPLFTGKHAELISRQLPVVLAKLARALRAAVGGLITKIREGCSQAAGATTHGVTSRPSEAGPAYIWPLN